MRSFQVVGLDYAEFEPLFSMSKARLREHGAERRIASERPGFPCRVSLKDAEVGDQLILLHYEHHAVDSPYLAAGPIFVREGAEAALLAPGELPECVTRRLISLRAYDATHQMLSAAVHEGSQLPDRIRREFAQPAVAYIHLHNAGPGCYSCRVVRAAA